MKNVLKYSWDHRTTVLGYIVIVLSVLVTAQDLFSERGLKWIILINGIITAILGHYNNSRLRNPSPPSHSDLVPPNMGQRGFVRPLFLCFLLAVSVPTVTVFQGCASTNPFSVAESPEQKAMAMYGTYQIVKTEAAILYSDPSTPESIASALKAANSAAREPFDALYASVVALKIAEEELAAGKTTSEKVLIATNKLLELYIAVRQPLTDLQRSLATSKKEIENVQ